MLRHVFHAALRPTNFCAGNHNLPHNGCRRTEETEGKIVVLVPAVFLGLCLIFFVPAGTLDYWEAWVYIAVLLVPFLFVLTYLLREDPELLARRIRFNEKESAQKRIIRVSDLIFLAGFLIP